MSPGTSSSAGSCTTCPSRRTRVLTISIFCSAATLASALPSCRRPIIALNSVRPSSTIPVPHCCSATMVTMPATSKTICIGSSYWRKNVWNRDSFLAAVNAFGPYSVPRLATSSALRPVALSTPCVLSASSIPSVCQAGAPELGGVGSDGGFASVVVMRYSLVSALESEILQSIDFGNDVTAPLWFHVPLGWLTFPEFDLLARQLPVRNLRQQVTDAIQTCTPRVVSVDHPPG